MELSRIPLRSGDALQWVLSIAILVPNVFAYECIEKCNHNGKVVSTAIEDDKCLISMPDNPLVKHNRNYPCEIQIETNCTAFCNVQLSFAKFNLDPCDQNVTYHAEHCDIVDSCEYVIIHEAGVDKEGIEQEYVTHFHGNLTSDLYTSKTDAVRLRFCYRSETFSARNIQMEYTAVDLHNNKGIYIGPISVYILGFVAVLLCVAIIVIRWCPWLRPCLDTPPVKKSESFDV